MSEPSDNSDDEDEVMKELMGEDSEEEDLDLDDVEAELGDDEGEEEEADGGDEEEDEGETQPGADQDMSARGAGSVAKDGGDKPVAVDAETKVQQDLVASKSAEDPGAEDARDDNDNDDDVDDGDGAEEEDDDDDNDDEDGEDGEDAGDGHDGQVDDADGGADATPGEDAAAAGLGEGSPKKRKGGKPKDPNAPQRPLNPFQQFSAVQRPILLEQNPAMRSDLSAMCKALAAAWADVPDEERTSKQTSYDREKAAWDAKMKVYKETEGYRKFQAELQSWLDIRQLKKLDKQEKKREGGWPKRPPRAFGAFSTKFRESLVDKGLTLSEMTKRCGEAWAALPAAERASYETAANEAQALYAKDLAKYKHSPGFRSYVDAKAALEKKQALRRLKMTYERYMPRRPPLPAQLFQRERNIPGTIAQVAKEYDALPDTEKQKYSADVTRLREQFAREMAAFKSSKEGARLIREEAAAKRRADVRAARQKFLVDAPPKPMGARGLFQAAHRAKSEVSAQSGAALTRHLEKLWDGATEAERAPFEKEAASLLADYQKRLEVFQQSDDYTKLKAVEDGSKGGKSGGRAKAKARAKAKGKKQVIKSMVPKPDCMPQPPPSLFQLFAQEQQAQGKGKASKKDFGSVPAEALARLEKILIEKTAAYRASMAAWEKSKDGKRYRRKVEALAAKAKTKRKVESAQAVFFAEAPRKPPSAMFLFASSKDKPAGPVAKCWQALDEEQKAKWEAERKRLVDEYEKRMEEFRNSKSYKRATGATGQARSSGRGGRGATPAKPASMPKKPLAAYSSFVSQKKLAPSVAAKAWAELSAAEKEQYTKEAAAALDKYTKELASWLRTPEGKKYDRATNSAAKKQQEQRLREKYLKAGDVPEAPKPPKQAFRIFADARREELSKQGQKMTLDMAKSFTEEWRTLGEAGQKQYEEKAAALRKEYEVQLQAYKKSAAYKKYEQAKAKAGRGRGGRATAAAKKEIDEFDEAYAAIYGKVSSGGGGGRGRGRGGRGRGGRGNKSDSDCMGSESDIMGSDTDSDDLGVSD